MEIKSLSASGYMDMPEKKITNISLQDQTQTTVKAGAVPAAKDTYNGQENEQKEKNINQLKSAIDVANNKLKFTKTKCEFKYYDDVNRVAIKVIDRETEEVIREIPPEETIELVQKLWELAGIIVDEKR